MALVNTRSSSSRLAVEGLRPIWRALLLLAAVVALNYGDRVIVKFVGIPVDLTILSSGKHEARLQLPVGNYTITFGRPRAACTVIMNERVIASNISPNSVRSQLGLFGEFTVINSSAINILRVECLSHRGFLAQLNSPPIVANSISGKLIHSWRMWIQTLMAPFATIAFFIFLLIRLWTQRDIRAIMSSKRSISKPPNIESGEASLILYASITVLYSLSASHLTRLFITEFQATTVHIILRSAYSLSFAYLIARKITPLRNIVNLSIIQFFSICIVAAATEEQLTTAYKLSYIIFVSTTAYATIQLIRDKTRVAIRFASIPAVLTVTQVSDLISLYLGFEVLTPALITITILSLTAFFVEWWQIGSFAVHASHTLEEILGSSNDTSKILNKVSLFCMNTTGFSRVSAYIDASLLGATDKTGCVMIRTYDAGYRKDTSKDAILDFSEGRGSLMEKSLREQRVIWGRGTTDQAFFAVIPIGQFACINVSDDTMTRRERVSHRIEILELLLPTLQRLKDRIADHSLKQCLALERLRAKYGNVRVEKKLGAYFVDVDKYSKYTDEFGDAFPTFVNDTYMPALIKRVGNFAAPEYMRGDEVYLVVIDDLIPAGETIETSLAKAIAAVHTFIESDGAALCRQHGYPTLSLKMGAAIGAATLFCDAIKVRTAGQTINDAKRLQDFAGEGELYVRITGEGPPKLPNFFFGSPTTVVQKKNIIRAVKATWDNTPITLEDEAA